MEKFNSLSEEKQNIIINAALKCFGTNGYKKASVSDIANTAGISKAMIFHYFGTKKALYLYLINLGGNIIMKEIEEKFDYSITDFFERIKLSSDIKASVMKKHPAILSFLTNIYFESDEEVKDDIKAILEQGEGFRSKIVFEGMDASKFKEGVDPVLVMKMLIWMAEGYANQLSGRKEFDLDVLNKEFFDCMEILKNNLYREECL